MTGTFGPGAGRCVSGLAARIVCLLALVALTIAGSGCGTGGIAVKKDIWQAEEDFERRQAGLSEKVLYMEGRIAALEEEVAALNYQNEQLSQQLSELDSDFSRGLEAVRDGQQQLGIELENRITSVDSGRESDKEDLLSRMQIILDEVTSENQRLRQDLDDLRSSVATGYSHEVKRGETLARIAQQYGVSVQAIVDANGITNPNVISVGDVLMIPAR